MTDRTRRLAVTALALACASPGTLAAHPPLHVGTAYEECYVKFAPNLTRSAFRRFVREFGSVSSFKQSSTPATLGKHRLAVAIERMSFGLDEDASAWNDTFEHPHATHWLGSRQSFPKLHARFGVADGLDLGLYYTKNPQSNYGWAGIEAKYRLTDELAGRPVGVAVRGAYTRTLYVRDMDMNALTADVSAEHPLGPFRPYAGLGAEYTAGALNNAELQVGFTF